jgi:3-deoxy-D-manno-octulosonic-acid transferase
MAPLLLAVYRTSLWAYAVFLRLAARFHPKAKAFTQGRRTQRKQTSHIRATLDKHEGPVIWMHCASLGEFEQGRPVFDQLRQDYPHACLVLTFFSPSGWEKRKNYPGADLVLYLPLDNRRNAREFIEMIRPRIAIFVKYEFWFFHLSELQKKAVPTYLISATFRPDQLFFRPVLGVLHRKMLQTFRQIFVQNTASADLLSTLSLPKVDIAGDTRVDRVIDLAENPDPLPRLATFAGTSKVFIAGSTWPADEKRLLHLYQHAKSDLKWIIAPHELGGDHLNAIQKMFGAELVRYTQASDEQLLKAKVLLLDTIGQLSLAYQYGTFAYIGGGFGKGIHNTLEPAAFGLPLLFGPNYQKFQEAVSFVESGAATPIKGSEDLLLAFRRYQAPKHYRAAQLAIHQYLLESKGATDRICRVIQQELQAPGK